MDDDLFFKRADAHIDLSNSQISDEAAGGKVSTSMMYATARFNAWLTACNCNSSEDMVASKQETIQYFIDSYRTC